jgi:S-DNA-T family DNA segregation ATPase FtsK/SpoIIIE
MAIFTDPGTVVYMSATKGPFQPMPAKVYATMPEAFPEGSQEHARMSSLFLDAARQLSDIRPECDPISAKAMGVAYAQRWARIIPNLRGDARGNVDASRMHESVWELYQSWETPVSYDLLLGRLTDDDGRTIPPSGAAAEIPRLSETILDDGELDRLAAQEAAIELARTAAKPKSNDDLAVQLFASMGRPAKPSEVFPLMVKAGYDKSERTFRDLCSKLGLQDRLVRGHDGTYAAVECGEVSHAAGRVPGSEDDADGRGDAPHERADLRPEEGGAQ